MTVVTFIFLFLVSAITASYSNDHPSPADLALAYQPKPLPSSHVVGGNPSEIFATMNHYLRKQKYPSRKCERFSHERLNEIATTLWNYRSETLADIYDSAQDNRRLYFNETQGLAYKLKLWGAERALTLLEPLKYGEGTDHYALVRQGKCAEIVSWWVHHLTAASRKRLLIAEETFKLPLLPATAPIYSSVIDEDAKQEVIYQVTCASCHSTGGLLPPPIGSPGGVPRRSKKPVNGVPAGTCPVDAGLPSVWYEPMSAFGHRKKRCDWDYDPPCALCEGIGGYSWGDQENDISYTSCKPYALPEDISPDNVTTPIWPMAFQVDEVTTLINENDSDQGRFPGANPCATHNFANDTETLWFTQDDKGPAMYTKTSSTEIWTLPTADMFIKVSRFYCICVTPKEAADQKAIPTGPLWHDFAKDSVLIGREIIGLEGLGMEVLADHWNKGPHHFWVDVYTNRFVRGWQPWNGLNVYDPRTWKIGAVDPKKFQIPKMCTSGPFHSNVSCIAGYPNWSPPPPPPIVEQPIEPLRKPGLFVRAPPSKPCCVGNCTTVYPGTAKYYSIAKGMDKTKHCGESCMDPKKYWEYKIFEPNLQPAPQGILSPCKVFNYTVYDSTVTHGGGPITITLDLYDLSPGSSEGRP